MLFFVLAKSLAANQIGFWFVFFLNKLISTVAKLDLSVQVNFQKFIYKISEKNMKFYFQLFHLVFKQIWKTYQYLLVSYILSCIAQALLLKHPKRNLKYRNKLFLNTSMLVYTNFCVWKFFDIEWVSYKYLVWIMKYTRFFLLEVFVARCVWAQ